jgi:hypothetical protein
MNSNIDLKDRHYLKHLEEIKEAYKESKDWSKVVSTAVYKDVDVAQEAFIDYVEEVYNTKIKDAKHLLKITGLKEDSLKEEANIKTGEENTFNQIITASRYSKYFRTLETALEGGATYPELLQISPNKFNLPKDFKRENIVGSDFYNSILWAISFSYLINEPAGLSLLPNLRSIAEEIKAPYSVVMDAYKLTRY